MNTTVEAEPAATWDVVRHRDDRYTVRLGGRWPQGWCGGLSLGLSAAGIDIERLAARRIAASRWRAELRLRPGRDAQDPASIDYLELARNVAPHEAALPVELIDYRISSASDAALLLELHGVDRTGFLGALLASLAGLSLFPERLHVSTASGVAHDRLELGALGGTRPSDRVRQALDEALQGMLREPAPPPRT